MASKSSSRKFDGFLVHGYLDMCDIKSKYMNPYTLINKQRIKLMLYLELEVN